MIEPNSTFNLIALAERLLQESRHEVLAHKIRRARDLGSLTADLAMAIDSLDALDSVLQTPSEPNDFKRLITESALLNNALILYARATKTTSEERGGFDLRSRFSEEQKSAHKELIELRDDAIAHFGSGGDYSGVWQAEVVVLQLKDFQPKTAVITRRQTLDRKLAARARKQIDAAHRLLTDLRSEKLGEVSQELNQILKQDHRFYLEVAQHPLNLDVFLASREAGDAARSSFDQGFGQGSVRHP